MPLCTLQGLEYILVGKTGLQTTSEEDTNGFYDECLEVIGDTDESSDELDEDSTDHVEDNDGLKKTIEEKEEAAEHNSSS